RCHLRLLLPRAALQSEYVDGACCFCAIPARVCIGLRGADDDPLLRDRQRGAERSARRFVRWGELLLLAPTGVSLCEDECRIVSRCADHERPAGFGDLTSEIVGTGLITRCERLNGMPGTVQVRLEDEHLAGHTVGGRDDEDRRIADRKPAIEARPGRWHELLNLAPAAPRTAK